MNEKQDKKRAYREYARYTGMALEMFGLILVLVLLGRYIDDKMGNPKKYVTIILVLIGLAGYLYRLYLQLNKTGKK